MLSPPMRTSATVPLGFVAVTATVRLADALVVRTAVVRVRR
jgi:hypothetical protein